MHYLEVLMVPAVLEVQKVQENQLVQWVQENQMLLLYLVPHCLHEVLANQQIQEFHYHLEYLEILVDLHCLVCPNHLLLHWGLWHQAAPVFQVYQGYLEGQVNRVDRWYLNIKKH